MVERECSEVRASGVLRRWLRTYLIQSDHPVVEQKEIK